MTTKLFKFIIFLSIFICAVQVLHASEEENENKFSDIQKKIEEYENKIEELKGQQKTLSSTITYLDNKILLTASQIAKTEEEIKILEEEIGRLSVKIERLNVILFDVSKILASKIQATYKRSFIKPFYLFFSSQSFPQFLYRAKYLKVAQENDRKILFEMEEAKQNYDLQKKLKEKKQAEKQALQKQLEEQKNSLAVQKEEKAALLEKTKNDEEQYQKLLAAARAELEAIQSIIAGKGEETQVGEVKAGEKIASIITGSSTCSTGTHLHFELVENGGHHDPTNFLKSISIIWDNKPDGEFSFSGSWDWPMNEPIRITQGYGMSYWARLGWYGGGPHTGLDIASESNDNVKAVRDGLLFRGSVSCGSGTMRYVKVDHKDSDIDTYYLHVNYY